MAILSSSTIQFVKPQIIIALWHLCCTYQCGVDQIKAIDGEHRRPFGNLQES